MLAVWVVLRFSGGIVKILRPGGIEVLTRIAGLLLAAIAVQLIVDAVAAFVTQYVNMGLEPARRARRALHTGLEDLGVRPSRAPPGPRPRAGQPEQLGFAGARRLFICTPSKLGAYADCPRRYRYAYLDRPAPPKGPPWAHNSLGASVHTALKNWYALPVDRRRPEALPALLKGTWVREGYRDDEQERAAYQRALGWLEGYVATLDPGDEPLGVERVVGDKTAVLAFNGRADRIDPAPARTAPSWSSSTTRPAAPGWTPTTRAAPRRSPSTRTPPSGCSAGRAAGSSCTTCRPAPSPAHDHTVESLARQLSRAEETARGRHGRRAGGGRRRRPGRGVPDRGRAALRLVRLPAYLPRGRTEARP